MTVRLLAGSTVEHGRSIWKINRAKRGNSKRVRGTSGAKEIYAEATQKCFPGQNVVLFPKNANFATETRFIYK